MWGWNKVAKRRFQLVLLKPSHYHDDGYVIRWWRALIPSNSLASVYGLALDCAQRKVLGPGRRDRHRPDRRDQYPRQHPEADPALPATRQFRPAGARGRAVEPVPARARYRASLPRRRRSDGDRRISRLRLPVDARRHGDRPRSRARAGNFHLRRRSRGAARRRPAGRRAGPLEAALQLHEGPAVDRRNADPVPAASVRRSAPPAPIPASTPAAAARSSARSAPSSTCRAASRASARPTTSRRSCATTGPRASPASSSPTTISPATRNGKRSTTGSPSCARSTRFRSA